MFLFSFITCWLRVKARNLICAVVYTAPKHCDFVLTSNTRGLNSFNLSIRMHSVGHKASVKLYTVNKQNYFLCN